MLAALRRHLIATLFIVLLMPPAAWAQFESAAVLGAISDPSGGAVAAAHVRLTNTSTNVRMETITNSNGAFEFVNVRLGVYVVQVEMPGFQSASTEPFDLRTNARQRVDVILTVGQVSESVTVSGSAALLETDNSSRGQVVTTRQITELPLNGRSYADLALMVPGVASSQLNNRTQYAREASFNVNGLLSTFNNFLLDGIDNNAYSRTNQGFSNQIAQPSPDALAEFKLETNNYSAEYGRAPGAVVNATIKSGTNELHGSVWEFARNTQLNAGGFFRSADGVKPTLVQNQFGAAAGGPILKDRMFVFADYEGFRSVSRSTTFITLPTAAMARGELGMAVKNPITGVLYPNGVVPASDITPFAKQVLAGLPATNLAGNANNYRSMPRTPWFSDKGDLRYDYYVSSKITTFARYTQSDTRLHSPGALPGPTPEGYFASGDVYYRNRQGVAGFTWMASPRSVLEIRAGGGYSEAGKTPIGFGTPSDLYNIPNLPKGAGVAGGMPPSQFAGGLATLGRQTTGPASSSPRPLDAKANYTWMRGRHSLKFGYEYQSINTADRNGYPQFGWDIYAGNFSNPTPSPALSALQQQTYSLADFMFGARYTYWLANDTSANIRQRMHFGYLQDDFRVNHKLTLNLGVRYEFATPEWEADNRQTNFDPTKNALIYAKSGSLSDRTLVNANYKNWAPRLGLAYQILPKTIVRAGYGISYVHFVRGGSWNLLAYNGPFVVSQRVAQSPAQGICPSVDSPAGACFRPTYLGYPNNFASAAGFNPASSEVHYVAPDYRTPYVQSWHVTIQQQLADQWLLDVAYAGNHSLGLVLFADRNQSVPNQLGQNLSLQARRPVTSFSTVLQSLNAGFGNYHGLQAKLEKRYADGLTLLTSFTWSKAIDNVSNYMEGSGSASMPIVNYNNVAAEKGLASTDQPFNSTTSVVYELPLGRGRRFSSSSRLVNALAGGWNVNAQNTMVSGRTLEITYTPATQAQVTTYMAPRPNLIGTPVTPEAQRTTANYLNPAAFSLPSYTQPFGNAGRNIARGLPLYQLDLGLHKEISLREGGPRLQFRAEAFNLLNKTNFGVPSTAWNTTAFGSITSTSAARQIQLALKLAF